MYSLPYLLAFLLGLVVLTTPSLADYHKLPSSNLGSRHVSSIHVGDSKKPLPPKPIHKPQALPTQHKPSTMHSEPVKSSLTHKKPLAPKPTQKHEKPMQKPPQKVKQPTSPLKTIKSKQHKAQEFHSETLKSPPKKTQTLKPIQKPSAGHKFPTKVKAPTEHKRQAIHSETLKSPSKTKKPQPEHKPEAKHSETLKSPSKSPAKKPVTQKPIKKPTSAEKPSPKESSPKTVKPLQSKQPTGKSLTLPPKVVKSTTSSKGYNRGHTF